MGDFYYIAVNSEGKKTKGTMQATDEADLQIKLKKKDLYLESVKEVSEQSNARQIRSDRLADFSQNIGKLTGAGVTLVRALRIICDDETLRDRERNIYCAVLKDVRVGVSLSDAMEKQGRAFPSMMINMYKSAEASGTLEQTANQMSVYYDKEYRLSKKISNSLLYPKILLSLMVIVLIIIMGFVIPRFKPLFDTMEGGLPTSTKILLAAGDFVADKWYVLILAAIVLYIIIKLLSALPGIRYFFDKTKIKIPVIGKITKVIYTARFGRTLASLYNAGIPIVKCLEISKGTVGNRYIESQFEDLIKAVQAGENLSSALGRVDGFIKKLSGCVLVGEETGKLDEMLLSTADRLEYESEVAVGKMVSMIEPGVIVLLAVLVGFIIIAVIKPIYGSYGSIANSVKR